LTKNGYIPGKKIVEQFQNKKNPDANNVYANLKLVFVQGRKHQAD